jgi:hypothetical protein
LRRLGCGVRWSLGGGGGGVGVDVDQLVLLAEAVQGGRGPVTPTLLANLPIFNSFKNSCWYVLKIQNVHNCCSKGEIEHKDLKT